MNPLFLSALVALAAPPVTPKMPVTDTYHGEQVTEAYRWLEDWTDARVKAWSDAQNTHTRAALDVLPDIAAIRARVAQVLGAKTVSWRAVTQRGALTFAMKRQPPKQQPFLVVSTSLDDPSAERVLVDPSVLDESGLTHIDWYVPSPDGSLVAVSLSKGGTESGDVHLFDVATGQATGEVVPRVNGGTAGGDLAWQPDGKAFFYTRYPRGEERPKADRDFFQQLYVHQLGDPTANDRYELGRDLPRIAEIQLAMHQPSGRLLATVQKGDGGEFAHYLRSKDGTWRQFSSFGDRVVQAAFGPRDDLYVLSRRDAPKGKLLRVQIADLDVQGAPTVVPEGEDNIVEDFWGAPTVYPAATKLFVVYQLGGPGEIRVFDLAGAPQPKPKQLPVSAVGGITSLGGDAILFNNMSYLQPAAWYRYDAATKQTRRTALVATAPERFDDSEVRREFATSKDGTKVPLNIMLPRGADLDGTRACVVTGYGGYGVSLEPWFSTTAAVLLEQGVIKVVANLRGGGEYGEAWHLQGNLTRKQNVFDDFAAGIAHVKQRGYCARTRVGIVGGSNGGLLMGATMVQHPTLASAVVSYVGIYDMLRVELSSNGAFNIPEFGTVKDAAHFEAMRAYSPYHNVVDGTKYPPTLFLTGANDPRVDPMQSRKMTARLQAANAAETPILLRTSADTGHGGGTKLTARIDQLADHFSFLFHHLGVKYRAPSK